MPKALLALLLAFCLAPVAAGIAGPARAASSEVRQEGVALRLLAERPGEDGRFRAALLIDLEPGWKTYWRDPGEAGIPPSLDFSGSTGIGDVATRFPVPHRFDDGFSTSIVYSAPLALAIEGRVDGTAGVLDLKLALGICRDICIPLSAELQAGLGSAEAAPSAVAGAFAALPKASTRDDGVTGAALSADGTSLAVTVRPAQIAEKADIFVSGGGGWFFGPPSSVARGGDAATLTVPVTGKPRRGGAPATVDAILSAPGGAWRADGLAVTAAGKG